MNAEAGTFTDLWVPSPELRLSWLYHPALSMAHPMFDILPDQSQRLLNELERQSNRWSHKAYFKDGLSSRRIAVLNGYHRADRLVKCMMQNNKYSIARKYQRCELIWFCPFCSYLKAQDLLKKYAPAWKPDAWYQLVFSLRGGICLSILGHDSMSQIWEMMRACIKRLKEVCSGFGGYAAWEELVVNCFWPAIIVTPHINVLFRAEAPPDIEQFARIARGEWPSDSRRVVPNLQFQPMKSEAHFYNFLKYVKPIDLLTPYNTGYRQAGTKGQIEGFHQGVREFFEGYGVESSEYRERAIKGVPRLLYVERSHYFYAGQCHGSAKEPLGVPTGIRRTSEHQDAIRVRVDEAKQMEEQAAEGTPPLQNVPRGTC